MRTLSRNKKQDRLCKERNQQMDKIPIPKKVINAMTRSMQQDHLIYYSRKGRYAQLTCSVTGQTEKYLVEDFVEGYEELCIKSIEKPVHKMRTEKCPCCGNQGFYIAEGRRKNLFHSIESVTYKAMGEQMLCGRIIEMTVWYRENDMNMPWDERVSIGECKRLYYDGIEQRMYRDYKKHGYCGTYWDYKKESWGVSNYNIAGGMVEYNAHEIYKTFLRYFDLAKIKGDRYFYLGILAENPELELLQKVGAHTLSTQLINGFSIRRDYKKSKPWERYRISKEMWNVVVKENKSIRFVEAAQKVREYEMQETRENVDIMYKLYEEGCKWPPQYIFQFATPKKLFNYLSKEHYRTRYETYRHYYDYIEAARECGYDLFNSVYLFPKDLEQKHDEMVARRNLIRDRKKIEEKEQKYTNIEKQYKKNSKKYTYKSGEFLIRPAMSAREIIEEGQQMHHCVGGDNYLSSHNTGKTFILLMRRVNAPEKPYCTIEIKDDKILQWYQAHDKKPDVDIIQPWIDKYIKHLKRAKKVKEGKKNGTNNIELAAG